MPWLIPALTLSVGLIYYCIGYTGYISTLKWNGVSSNPQFVGLENYVKLAGDPVFQKTMAHVALFFVVGFAAQAVLGLGTAIMLHSRLRCATLYKIIVFIPALIAPAIMAPVHRRIFAKEGFLNWILEHVGLGRFAQPWLAQGSTALWVVIFVQIWSAVGFGFILYYAAISQIEPEVMEAARLDGAGNIRVIVSVIVPAVKPTTVALAILYAINSLKTFDIPYLVTRGGPNYASEFLGTYIYTNTVQLAKVGYAGALSIVLLVLSITAGVVFSRTSRSKR
jgi:ABC-type sugar transport system permease subunit